MHLAVANLANRVARVTGDAETVESRLTDKANRDEIAALEERLKASLVGLAKASDEQHAQVVQAIQALAARPVGPSRLGEAALGALRAVAMVLAVRLLLLLSLLGTFVLAVMAMQTQSVIGVCLTAAFALLTIGPLVALEVRQRPPALPVA